MGVGLVDGELVDIGWWVGEYWMVDSGGGLVSTGWWIEGGGMWTEGGFNCIEIKQYITAFPDGAGLTKLKLYAYINAYFWLPYLM